MKMIESYGLVGILWVTVPDLSKSSDVYLVHTDAERSLSHRRLLFLGYQSGLQVWDCTNLGSVCEVMNVSREDGWGRVSLARVLPAPIAKNDKDLACKRPLIGVV